MHLTIWVSTRVFWLWVNAACEGGSFRRRHLRSGGHGDGCRTRSQLQVYSPIDVPAIISKRSLREAPPSASAAASISAENSPR